MESTSSKDSIQSKTSNLDSPYAKLSLQTQSSEGSKAAVKNLSQIFD